MTHRIASVSADPDTFTLAITWRNKARTVKQMKALIGRYRLLRPLADPRLFVQVRPVDDGHAIVWPGGIDMSADSLWFESHPEDNPFPDAIMTGGQFKNWMAENGFSHTTAAAALGLSRRQVSYYASGEKPIPKFIFLACIALSDGRDKHRAA